MLSDRLKIKGWHKSGKVPTDVNLSAQALLDCGAALPGIGSCHGGSAQNALEFIHKRGITDETCSPYVAAAPGWWAEADCWTTLCRTCDTSGSCEITHDGHAYFVDEYGLIQPPTQTSSADNVLRPHAPGSGAMSRNEHTPSMVLQMQTEIIERGPIVCGMYAHSSSFLNYLPANMGNYTDGVIVDPTPYPGITHGASVSLCYSPPLIRSLSFSRISTEWLWPILNACRFPSFPSGCVRS